MITPCGNRIRQDTEIMSSLPESLVHFAKGLQDREMAGNRMISESSIVVPKACNARTVLEIPLAFALLSKNNLKLYSNIKYSH